MIGKQRMTAGMTIEVQGERDGSSTIQAGGGEHKRDTSVFIVIFGLIIVGLVHRQIIVIVRRG